MDLTMIKERVDEGYYSNLKMIQDDMILIVKNTRHFNEPGADVYKVRRGRREEKERGVGNRMVEKEHNYK